MLSAPQLLLSSSISAMAPSGSAHIFEVPQSSEGYVSAITAHIFTYELSHRYQCPNAGCEMCFKTHDALALHLNPSSSCYLSAFFQHSTTQSVRSDSCGLNGRARYHATSGHTFGRDLNAFEKMDNGPFKQEQDINLYYPFRSRGEWSLAKFLAENLTQAQKRQFLSLHWVDHFRLNAIKLH